MSLSTELAECQQRRSSMIEKDLGLKNELKADAIIRKIRDNEAKGIWKEEHPSILHPFPGMEILTGRSIITKTKLFQILNKMPNGALLHAHLTATVNDEFVLAIALQQPAIHVRVQKALTASNLTYNLPEFRPLPIQKFSRTKSLTDKSYTLGEWVSLQSARATFNSSMGGPVGFDKWAIGAMTINPCEAYGTHKTITKIWQKLSSCFQVSAGLIRYEPIFSEYIRQFILSSIAIKD